MRFDNFNLKKIKRATKKLFLTFNKTTIEKIILVHFVLNFFWCNTFL